MAHRDKTNSATIDTKRYSKLVACREDIKARALQIVCDGLKSKTNWHCYILMDSRLDIYESMVAIRDELASTNQYWRFLTNDNSKLVYAAEKDQHLPVAQLASNANSVTIRRFDHGLGDKSVRFDLLITVDLPESDERRATRIAPLLRNQSRSYLDLHTKEDNTSKAK